MVPFSICYKPSISEPDINSFKELKSVLPRFGDSCRISQNSFIKSCTGEICSTVAKLLLIFNPGSF
uniref:Uncharacterized protein n=1 Tax=Podoviridae sp. ct8Lf7 TaxID=2827723 RepID=A0A8S5S139_9CAUD|nr:MAG TPA: hypothetical protein [Podoviridae sp. ct8Lf7]